MFHRIHPPGLLTRKIVVMLPQIDIEFAVRGSVGPRRGPSGINRQPGKTLRDVVVQFPGETGAFRLLRLEQPPAKIARRLFR